MEGATPELGPPVLLASGRIGRCVDVHAADRSVYVGIKGQLMCAHGEKLKSISGWIRDDTRLPEGAPRARATSFTSVCDCDDVRGLYAKRPHIKPTDWPKQPSSLYDFLENKTEEVVGHDGYRLRFALVNPRGVDVFVNINEKKRCRHGNSATILERHRKRVGPPRGRSKGYPVCGCHSLATPQRQDGVFSYNRK